MFRQRLFRSEPLEAMPTLIRSLIFGQVQIRVIGETILGAEQLVAQLAIVCRFAGKVLLQVAFPQSFVDECGRTICTSEM